MIEGDISPLFRNHTGAACAFPDVWKDVIVARGGYIAALRYFFSGLGHL